MGWAHGILDGKEVGYAVADVCNEKGCDTEIDCGLAYLCGNLYDDIGCGDYFCYAHLFCGPEGSGDCWLCKRCSEREAGDEEN